MTALNRRLLRSPIWVFALTIALVGQCFCGCGPSASEIAARKAFRERMQSELRSRQDRLASRVDERMAAGDKSPAQPKDPGFPLGECVSPALPEDAVAIQNLPTFGISADSFVCTNTKGGRAILAWRSWYCSGEVGDCVTGAWKDGRPTFDDALDRRLEIRMHNGTIVIVPAAVGARATR
jgi:hypothetical protein